MARFLDRIQVESQMDGPRYSPSVSRQKACDKCHRAKAKCDRKARGCNRCASRGLQCSLRVAALSTHTPQELDTLPDREPQRLSDAELCSYLQSSGRLPTSWPGITGTSEGRNGQMNFTSIHRVRGPKVPAATSYTEPGPAHPTNGQLSSKRSVGGQACPTGDRAVPNPIDEDVLDFSNLKLACPINADAIHSRWLNSYLPVGQTSRSYNAPVTMYIYQTLKAYTLKLIHNRGFPPFVHGMQKPTDSNFSPLLTCLGLARACEEPFSDGINVAGDALEREMSNLHQNAREFDTPNMLSVFQSYLLYTMLLYFKIEQRATNLLRNAMMNLHDIASLVCRSSIVCRAEQQHNHTKPKWEAWIIAEASRRTLYVMYLFDSLLSARDGLPSFFLGVELQGLPAPASRQLWYAQNRHSWDARYSAQMAAWPSGGLRIDELWTIPQDTGENLVQGCQHRVHQWVGEVDEFGTMLYAVTCFTNE